jgi:hypothetical protein
VWSQSGSGRIAAIGMLVIGGAIVERMKCKDDGGNEWDG